MQCINEFQHGILILPSNLKPYFPPTHFSSEWQYECSETLTHANSIGLMTYHHQQPSSWVAGGNGIHTALCIIIIGVFRQRTQNARAAATKLRTSVHPPARRSPQQYIILCINAFVSKYVSLFSLCLSHLHTCMTLHAVDMDDKRVQMVFALVPVPISYYTIHQFH